MDIEYLLLLQKLRESLNGALDGFFLGVSKFADGTAIIIVSLIIYWAVSRTTGLFLILSGGIGNFLNGVAKLACCVYRPWIRDARIQPVADAIPGATGYSFPSGHSTQSACFFGSVSYLFRKKKAVVILCAAATILIMFSRNYLGVHTPQDVLVGAAMGVVTVFLTGWILKKADSGKNADYMIAGIAVVLSAMALLYFSVKKYPMDYSESGALIVDPQQMMKDSFKTTGLLTGIALGWLFERRKVCFTTDNISAGTRIIRIVVGIALVLGIYKGLGAALKSIIGVNWGSMVSMVFLGFFGVGGCPWIFKMIEKKIVKTTDK